MFKDDDFVEASVNIRLLEKHMLSNTDINRILESPSALETLKQISQNSEYDFQTLKKIEDYEDVLKAGIKKTYDLLYVLSPSKTVIDIHASKYTFHNLKVVLKSKYTGVNMKRLYSDITESNMSDVISVDDKTSKLKSVDNKTSKLKSVDDEMFKFKNDDTIVSRLEDYVFNEESGDDNEFNLPVYIKAAVEDIREKFDNDKDPQVIDILSDKHMFVHMLSLCNNIKNDFITEFVRTLIDFHNIKAFLRIKNMNKGSRFLNESLVSGGLTDIEFFLGHYDKSSDMLASVFYYKYFGDIVKQGIENYSRTKNYMGLEKLFDNYMVNYTKKVKYIAFGPEVLFAYIFSKENELRQIRMLIAGKYNNLRIEDLKERVRDNYA